MSAARKCDRCAEFFQPEQGCLVVEVSQYTEGGEDEGETWLDYRADLCEGCAKLLDEFFAARSA